MDLGLLNHVFVVTGGSRGLGRASAQALVAEGARVTIGARDEARLSDVVAALGGPDVALGVAGDLTDAGYAERLTAAAVARFGRLDGAVLSCGGPPAGDVVTTTDDQWRAGFEGAFLGPLRAARAVTLALGEQGGSLLFVLSSTASAPIPDLATSNGLRPGLANVVRQMSVELAARAVRVNGLLPGRIDTDRVRELDARSGRAETVRRRRESTIPLGRYGDPIEFGTVAAFVSSPAASYVSGALIPVDGAAAHVAP